MADAISVNLQGLASTGASNATGSGSASQLEALQKKLAELQKQLSEVAKDQSKAAMQKAKLIQQQIQLVQAQIAQLQAEQAKRAEEARQNKDANAVSTAAVASAGKSNPPNLGNSVDEYI